MNRDGGGELRWPMHRRARSDRGDELRWPPRRLVHSDRGGIAVWLAMALCLWLAGGVIVVTALTDLGVAVARARGAADAAALAGMAASPLAGGSGAPRPAAVEAAAANAATLVATEEDGWPLRYAVTVSVQPLSPLVVAIAGPVQAKATAAVRPATDPEAALGLRPP